MKTISIPPALLLAVLVPVSANTVSVVQFQAGNFEGHESSGTGHLTLTSTPPPTNRVTVLLKATGGSADFADVLFVGGHRVDRASWQAGWPVELVTGNTEKGVYIGIVDDGAPEPDETLHLTLTVLTGDAVVGAQSNAVFTIRNGHPRIFLSSDGWPLAAEEGAPLRCEFRRSGDTNVVLSVQYATEDDTARAGVDYIAAAGTVTFGPGQLAAEIAVATLDNGRVDGDRAFRLRLSSPSPGVEVVSPETLGVIRDNERPVVWDRTFAPKPVSQAMAFAPASDGKLVLTEELRPPLHPAHALRIVRWNADGTLDSGFTPAQIAYPQGYPHVQRVVLDAAGRCYVAGRFETVNQQPRPGLARLLPNGALDESFRPPPGLVFPYGPVHLAVQPDGRLLGSSYDGANAPRFVRLNTDGSLDGTFRPAAVATNERKLWATLNNQALVEVAEYGGPFSELPYRARPLARLAADGSLDPTFHRAEFGAPNGYGGRVIENLVRQPDGKLLVCGTFRSVDGHPRPNLVRLNADGTVDAGFAPPAESGLGDTYQTIRSLALDGEGRVLAVGQFRRFNGKDAGSGFESYFLRERMFSLVRLQADGMPDAAFAPLGDEELRQLAPDMHQPFAGGRMIEVFPQAEGKLLAYGYLMTKGSWSLVPGPHVVVRLHEAPPATSVELALARIWVEPGEDQALVTVRRLGDSSGPASVHYATHDGSAVAGRDYVAVSGSLSFAPLEVEKSFTVPLPDPALRRQDRELSVTLSDATGVAGISGPTARLVLVAPFGFQHISGPPTDPRLTIHGSVGSTYLLESSTLGEHPRDPWSWIPAATAVTLTNEVQAIPDDPSWHNAQPVRFYRLRHLAP